MMDMTNHYLRRLGKLRVRFLSIVALLFAGTCGIGQTLSTVVSHSASTELPIVEPHSITVATNGLVYFTDAGGIPGLGESAHRVMSYDTTKSKLSVLAGDLLGGRGTNSGTGINARFNIPAGIVAARGGLVVADSGNQLIRFVGFDGTVTNIAGAPLSRGLVDGVGSNARFNTPLGLAVDSAGNIYVADSINNVIRRIAPDDTVSTYATGFNQPNGLAVGDGGELWVADTLNHQIKAVQPGGAVVVRAGQGIPGFTDAFPNALGALLTSPRAVFWMGDAGLLVSDSGNGIVRRLFPNTSSGTYTIETSVGVAGEKGFVNGDTATARLDTPLGIAGDTLNGAFLVVDVGNRAIRRVQQTEALPPVSKPRVGYVFLAEDSLGNLTARLQEVTHSVFNNEVPIQIVAENGVDTFFTFGSTPTNVFIDTLPDPSAAGSTAVSFTEGGSVLPGSIIQDVVPDMTIKVQSSQAGRVSSAIASARFQFTTGNPEIIGDNAANFVLGNITTNAQMYYTIDGSEPTNGAPSRGPVSSGTALSFDVTAGSLLFKARAFKTGFKPSATVSNLFSATDFKANKITFGFEDGTASSAFKASAGSTFYAPVTLSLVDTRQVMYSLQFGLLVTNTAGFAIPAGAVGFHSTLTELVDGFYRQIAPSAFSHIQTNITLVGGNSVTNLTPVFTNLVVTNPAINLLSVGWLEINGDATKAPIPGANLFNTTLQNLITYSLAHDFVLGAAGGQVVVGGYAIQIPTDAPPGQEYRIRIIRPSATTDGQFIDSFIDAPTGGNATGPSPINAVKVVTVGSPNYIVGDVHPFRWWNAGDFGDTNILNVDVVQVFRSVVYSLNRPLPGSDMEDAMDSCCNTATLDTSNGLLTNNAGRISTATISQGGDAAINNSVFGDGTLDIADIWVTFRRSLDPTLTNYLRFRSNGVHYATPTSNLFRGVPTSLGAGQASASAVPPERSVSSLDAVAQPSKVFYAADSIVGSAGQIVSVPVRASVLGGNPMRLLALNITVVPVFGSDPLVPALDAPVEFIASASMGDPTTTTSLALNNVAMAWLNPGVAGISGDGIIGHVRFRVPSTAGDSAAYAVRIEKASASSFGVDRMAGETVSGLVSLIDRSGTNTLDGIPDEWRIRHFQVASVSQNLLSAGSADADGDGFSNWQEFKAGTNPNERGSLLDLRATGEGSGNVRLRWPSRANRRYLVEYSESLVSPVWKPLGSEMAGDGTDLEISAPSGGVPRFYRVRLAEQ